MRLLFWVLLVVLAAIVVRRLTRKPPARRPSRRPAQRMVRCARCGIHVPEAEAVGDGERLFCSVEHQRAAPPPNP
jgi:uncharacterized protein